MTPQERQWQFDINLNKHNGRNSRPRLCFAAKMSPRVETISPSAIRMLPRATFERVEIESDFLGWKGGVVCPAQNLCVSQSGSDCCSCRCILQGMIQNSISCWLRTDRAKQTWTGNWVKFTSTLNEFVMKGQFFTDFNYRNSKTFFIACFNIPN